LRYGVARRVRANAAMSASWCSGDRIAGTSIAVSPSLPLDQIHLPDNAEPLSNTLRRFAPVQRADFRGRNSKALRLAAVSQVLIPRSTMHSTA
jgi:hypothetical protein